MPVRGIRRKRQFKYILKNDEKNLFGEYTQSIIFKLANSAGVDIANGGENTFSFFITKGSFSLKHTLY